MKLFNRQKSGEQSPPVTQEYYIPEEQVSTSRIDWKRAIPRLLAVIIIAGLLIWGVALAIGALTEDDKSTANGQQSESTSKQADEKKESDKDSSGQSTGSTSGSTSESTATSETESNASTSNDNSTAANTATNQNTAAPAPAANNGKLADSGPAETIAVFIGATIIGTFSYHALVRRRV